MRERVNEIVTVQALSKNELAKEKAIKAQERQRKRKEPESKQ